MENTSGLFGETGYRDAIINALSKTIEIFTSYSGISFDEVISTGLKPVADAAGLNRIAVYRLLDKDSGRMGQIYVWAYGKTVPLDKELVKLPNVSPITRWLEILTKGECVHGNVLDMDSEQAAFCGLFNIKSILFVPIFTHGEFWGIVTLEDHVNYRYFCEDCLDLLRSAARLCANAFIRNEMGCQIAVANEFNRATIAAMPMGFTAVDNKLKFVECNKAILDLLETTKEEYLNNFYNYSPKHQPNGKESKKMASHLIKKALDGKTQIFEWIHRSSHGVYIPFEITLTRVMYKGNYIVLAYQYDLQNIKEMEKAITEAEELTRAITDASQIPYVLFDKDLQPLDCNDAAVRVFNSPDKKYLLENYWEKFLPEKQPDGQDSYEKAMAITSELMAGRQTNFEWIHKSFDGESIPMENTMTYVTRKGKNLIISYKYDLRNTKKMLDNIREQSELLKTKLELHELISEISRGFISSGDSDMYINEAIAKVGYYHNVSRVLIFNIEYKKHSASLSYYWTCDNSHIVVLKNDVFKIITDSFPERLPDCATLPVLFCEDIKTQEERAYRPLLEAGINAFIVVPLYVEGLLWGFLSVEHCQSRRWTENEKSFIAMTASTIAGVIMRNIYNTMLKEALEKATIASKAKSEFLSNMSHEMRTPLNAIVGMAMIAKNAVDLERKNYALKKIEDASTHLLGVINDVLDMSKIEANKLELSYIEFNFRKTLRKAIVVVTFRVEEKRQKLLIHIDKNIPEYLFGDDQRLSQVIINLLVNAVKFTPNEGSISLDARFISEENRLCTIQISVTDSGIGISEELKTRLFQSFQQAEASTVRKYGGTGLGLAISKNIIEMMGGNISLESELGRGSTFTFTILAKRGKDNASRSEADSGGEEKERAPGEESFAGHHILLVEDMEINREIVLSILEPLGLKIDCAGNGVEAVKMFRENFEKYEMIFMDIQMPEMDGFGATRGIRDFEEEQRKAGRQLKKIPIVAMTANVFREDIEKCLEAEMDDHIGKPLDFEIVMEKLRAHLLDTAVVSQ